MQIMPKIHALFDTEIWGYSLRRWAPSIVALALILTHAIASPFWWRIATDTKATSIEGFSGKDVSTSDPSVWFSRNELRDDGPAHAKRVVQAALDTEREGMSRANARGAIALPPPTITMTTDGLKHVFRCNFVGFDCRVDTQSPAYFVHIVKGPDFVSCVIVDRPTLSVRSVGDWIEVDARGLTQPRVTQLTTQASDYFPDGIVSVLTSDAEEITITRLGLRLNYLFNLNASAPLTNTRDFAPLDLTYTLDFTQPDLLYLSTCLYRNIKAAEYDAAAPVEDCSFTPDEIAVFTLAACDETHGQCPGTQTDPLDDLATHPFQSGTLKEETSMGFISPQNAMMFELAQRYESTQALQGRVDLPDRTTVIEMIILDYLTVAGIDATSPEFRAFLAANPDVDADQALTILTNMNPILRANGVLPALRRQPQLWAWHRYAQHLKPELMTTLARDLVKLGLANPY